MNLLGLPDDALELIERRLPTIDTFAWRMVRGHGWTPSASIRHARRRLEERAPAIRATCVHCRDACVTELRWRDRVVPWVPYCVSHAPDALLADVDVYCVRGLDAIGTVLVAHAS